MPKKFLAPIIFSLLCCTLLVGCSPTTNPATNTTAEDKGTNSSTTTNLSLNITKNGTPYLGSIIAGTTSPLLVFQPEDYQKAQIDKKNIILIFCNQNDTACLTEMQSAITAFNQINNNNLVGFNLKYDSPDTSEAEKQIATQYQVTSEPTKIIVNTNGEKLLQTSDNWNSKQYQEQLSQLQ